MPALLVATDQEEQAGIRRQVLNDLPRAVLKAGEKRGAGLERLTTRDAKGRPLLSWRVAILPYIPNLEKEWLSRAINVDQSWDSKGNLGWTRTEVTFFNTAGTKEQGTTTWKLIPKVQGGILLVEGGEGSAVPWTQPDEVKLDGGNPLVSFGREPQGGFTVILLDGRVVTLTSEQLKEKLSKKRGE